MSILGAIAGGVASAAAGSIFKNLFGGGESSRGGDYLKNAKEYYDTMSDFAQMNYGEQAKYLNYLQDKYQDWEYMYGPVQDNLAEYYRDLSGDTLASRQLTEQARQYSKALDSFRRQMAQRGLSGSGAEARGLANMGMQNAATNAAIRSAAPDMAAQAQMQWLGNIGMPQQTMWNNAVGNQMGRVGQAYNLQMQPGLAMMGQYNQMGQQAYQNAYNTRQDFMGGIGNTLGTVAGYAGKKWLDSIFNKPSTPTTTNNYPIDPILK
jgi:hypothetical protein